MLTPHRTPRRHSRFGSRAIAMQGADLWAARIMVGFNVGGSPKWTIADLRRVVARSLSGAGLMIGSTFVPQEGFYQPAITVKPVAEQGAQVIILNFYDKLPPARFVANVKALARSIRRNLQQSEVLVWVTYRGRTVRAWIEKDTREWKSERRDRRARSRAA